MITIIRYNFNVSNNPQNYLLPKKICKAPIRTLQNSNIKNDYDIKAIALIKPIFLVPSLLL